MVVVTAQAPVFSNVEITLGHVTGRLKCSATGDPAPTLYWIQPNGRTTKYSPSSGASVAAAPAPVGLGPAAGLPGAVEDGARRTDGVLVLSGRSSTLSDSSSQQQLSGMYICVANNEAGNVTLAVNISWPLVLGSSTKQRPRTTTGQKSLDRGPPLDDSTLNLTLLEDELSRRKGEEGTASRLFSVTQLVCAVLVTHVVTLLIVVALVVVFVQRRAARRRRQQQLLPPVHPGLDTRPGPGLDPGLYPPRDPHPDPRLLPPVHPTPAAAVPTNEPADPRLQREPVGGGVGSTYWGHNGFQLPGMTVTGGRTTPYANDCSRYESGSIRSGFTYTPSNRRS